MSTFDSSHIKPGNFLLRFLMIIVYFLILSVIRFVLWAVVLVQVLFHLFAGRASVRARRVGEAVSDYMYRVWRFMTYNTNERPFPFGSLRR